MPDARVSPRERLVLTAIIELYIATGEPVASQAVAHFFADREGLSSATIRNVMATLGEAGLLEQPHTSAGRVPTPLPSAITLNRLPSRAAWLPERSRPPGRSAARRILIGAVVSERSTPRADRGELLGRHQHQRLSGAHVACSSAAFQRPRRRARQLHNRPDTGTHPLFTAFHRTCACRAGYSGRRVQDRVLALDRELTKSNWKQPRATSTKIFADGHRAHPL